LNHQEKILTLPLQMASRKNGKNIVVAIAPVRNVCPKHAMGVLAEAVPPKVAKHRCAALLPPPPLLTIIGHTFLHDLRFTSLCVLYVVSLGVMVHYGFWVAATVAPPISTSVYRKRTNGAPVTVSICHYTIVQRFL
jgi:hypothetical protein